MKSDKASATWIPAMEASKLLRVHYNTIRNWMKTGRVKYKIGTYKNVEMALILTSSLKTAFNVKCRWCGKVIKIKKPGKTRYCCLQHRWAWGNRKRSKKTIP